MDDEETLELPYEGGVTIRAYQRIDVTNNHHMLDFMVYPLPPEAVNELAEFLRQQTEKWLLDKGLADGEFHEVTEVPSGATLQ